MNQQLLLRYFDRISEAPDAVLRLRQFVFDLAVRGKLVEQEPGDEPSSRLLQRIQSEKARLLDGRSNKIYSVEPIAAKDTPFHVPSSWTWVRLGDVCSKTGSGSTPRGGKSVYQLDGVPFLRSQNIHDDGLRLEDVAYINEETHSKMSGTAVRPDDLLLNITGGSIGRCCRVPHTFGDANVSQHVAIIRVAIADIQPYLHYLILSPYFQSFVINEQTGAGRGGLPKNRMDRIPVALPPLAEQGRIVARIDELKVLCDQLERSQQDREARRDRLAAASFHNLNDGAAGDDFRANAGFYINHLPTMTARPDQVTLIRHTILNLAVRGQLLPQDPDEVSASQLLKLISEEKLRLVKEGKIRSEVPPIPATADELVFPLKQGWVAARTGQILVELQTGPFGSSLHQSDYQKGGTPVVNPASIKDERLVPIDSMAVGPATLERLAAFKLRTNDIVMGRRGEMGRCAVVTEQETGWLCGTGSLILRLPSCVFPRFFVTLIGSPFVRKYLGGAAVGATMQNLNQSILLNLVVGLPPLAEQRRIISKVDELMVLCDQLETQMTTAHSLRLRLLDAVLHEALNPVIAAEAA